MKISVISARELDERARARWLALQRSNPALASPCFCPEFTLGVAHACADVRIAVMEESNAIVGFFPFQARWTVGAPVGRLMSDHHGVICAPATRWRWGDLLRAAGLSCWRFDALCAAQARDAVVRHGSSPGLDLSRGFAAYKEGRVEAHRHSMRRFERMARKLEREMGPLRFVENARDAEVFDALLRLKSEQYRRTGSADVFKLRWPRALLEWMRHTDLPHFGGRLAAFYVDDKLAAASFGIRSDTVWHVWFPAHEPAMARYSPGIQLLLLTAEEAARQGHRLLDLGRGDEAYKAIFADHETPLAEGAFARSAAASSVFIAPYRAARWLLSTPVGQQLRPWVRRARGL
ncbi:MAG: GNAT family N-acetyltransferase [Frateuria sp.]|nr:GNAT family N-acetyltransferase [Frateuria sp.]